MTISSFDYALLALRTYNETKGPCHLTEDFNVQKDLSKGCYGEIDRYSNLQKISALYVSTILKSSASLDEYNIKLLDGGRLGLIRLSQQYRHMPDSLQKAIYKLTHAVLTHPTRQSFKSRKTIHPLP